MSDGLRGTNKKSHTPGARATGFATRRSRSGLVGKKLEPLGVTRLVPTQAEPGSPRPSCSVGHVHNLDAFLHYRGGNGSTRRGAALDAAMKAAALFPCSALCSVK